MRERVRGPGRARLNRISNSPVPLLEARKRRQIREIVISGPPGGLLEALKTINVSRIVAWGDFWVLLGPQRAPKAPLRSLVGAS